MVQECACIIHGLKRLYDAAHSRGHSSAHDAEGHFTAFDGLKAARDELSVTRRARSGKFDDVAFTRSGGGACDAVSLLATFAFARRVEAALLGFAQGRSHRDEPFRIEPVVLKLRQQGLRKSFELMKKRGNRRSRHRGQVATRRILACRTTRHVEANARRLRDHASRRQAC